jgi:hypothetical protein
VALRRRRKRGALDDSLTRALGALAGATSLGVLTNELLRIRRRGPADATPAETALEAVEVAVEGIRRAPLRESSLLSLLVSFNGAWLLARLSTYAISRRGRFGPFRNAVVGRTHVHHFVPGIVLMLLAGTGSILSRDEAHDPLLAIPFGVGAALTLDESALLLRLDDVYWSEEGILSVQISLAAASLISAGALATRILRRGEGPVLESAA